MMKHTLFKRVTAFLLGVVVLTSAFFCCFTPAIADTAPEAKFSNEYVSAEAPLCVEYYAPAGVTPSYHWLVDGKEVFISEEPSFTVSVADKGKMIRCDVYDGEFLLSSCQMLYSDLPVVYLDTENGAAVTSKTEYIGANVKIAGNSLYNSENTTLYDGACTVKGHGNSTWLRFDKKAYKIKLDKKTDLFGMGKNKSWLLIANYIDETSMRNKLSCYYAKAIGTTAMDSKWVDVVMNGQYIGLYDLYEQVKISKERVNIYDWEDAAGEVAKAIAKAENFADEDADALKEQMEQNLAWITEGTVGFGEKTYTVKDYYKKLPATTDGGFLMELDRNFDEISQFKTDRDVPIMFKSPEYLNTNEEMFSYIETYVKEMEETFYSKDKTIQKDGKTLSYVDYCDPYSLVSFWLASEFMKNEIGYSSNYFHKQVGERITFGPVWDFDYSSNGVSPFYGTGPYSWNTKGRYWQRAWFSAVMESPYFAVKARELFFEKEDEIAAVLEEGGLLEQWHDYLKNSALHNESVWKYSRGFEKDYEKLREFIVQRLDWVGGEFETDEKAIASFGGSISEDVALELSGNGVSTVNAKEFWLDEAGNDALQLTITTADTALASVNVYVNARFAQEIPLENGKAVFTLDKVLLDEAQGKKNCISVWAKNAQGELVKQQFCTARTVAAANEKTVVFENGTILQSVKVAAGDKIRLPQPDQADMLLEGWQQGGNTYAGGCILTIENDSTFVAVYAPCIDGQPTHTFAAEQDDSVCTRCGKHKNDSGAYVDIRDCFFNIYSKYSKSYTGKPVCPDVIVQYGDRQLQQGKDYTITFKNNVDIGFATYEAKGIKSAGFSGAVELTFKIIPVSIRSKTVSCSLRHPTQCYYTGKAVTPALKLTYLENTLQEGKDYRVEYSNNVKPGKAVALVYGLGNYARYDLARRFTFTISKADVSKLSPVLPFKTASYTGKAIQPTVKFLKAAGLKQGKDYTVKYENNKAVGTAKVIITGIGSYKGKSVLTFTIGPKAVSITSLRSPAKDTVKVRYTKGAGVTGYQIVYSATKDFKKYNVVNVKGARTNAKTICLAKHRAVLYCKLRAYKTVNGVKYYNAFSKVKSVKVKAK